MGKGYEPLIYSMNETSFKSILKLNDLLSTYFQYFFYVAFARLTHFCALVSADWLKFDRTALMTSHYWTVTIRRHKAVDLNPLINRIMTSINYLH